MRRRSNTALQEWVAIIGVVSSIGLLVFNLVAYSGQRERLPAGMIIAGVPVGSLTPDEARAELGRIYSTPIELHYREAVFTLDPAQISFRLDTQVMLARADTYRTESNFWSGFWDYLWQQPGKVVEVNLSAEYSQEQLRSYLQDVAARYDSPPSAGQGDSVALTFGNGQPGFSLDTDSSMAVIDFALRQPTNRRAALTILEDNTAQPTMIQLEEVINQYLLNKQFAGIASIVVIDIRTGQELDLNPDVAFTGMSVMKIPIILQTYLKWDTELPPETLEQIGEAALRSSNFHANLLLTDIGDGSALSGAQTLTDTMRRLGLQNTFMAKAFDQDAPVDPILTPANQRADFNTNPDPYIQTTASDIATLLLITHECASTGGGPLAVVFPGGITQAECQTILSQLAQNQTGVQIDGGVPEGTRVAHKEGLSDNAYGDAGIVFSPAGDYVIVEYIWTPEYLNWEYGAPLMADISRAVYNYFNQPANSQ
ncbi:MAG TPA: serine hydrolase [Anaerolineales bacterium]|nr:serine hydrolase [Anaerolineales bacterium]